MNVSGLRGAVTLLAGIVSLAAARPALKGKLRARSVAKLRQERHGYSNQPHKPKSPSGAACCVHMPPLTEL